jgi:hypothetical protein
MARAGQPHTVAIAAREGGVWSATSFVLIAWVALLAADRIDFLGGHGAFTLPPYLVLTPLVLVLEGMRRILTRSAITIPRAAGWYGVLSLTLVSLAIASVFTSPELAISAPRVVLFIVQVLSSFAVVLLVADRRDLYTVIDRGAVAGLLLFVAFDVLQLAWLLGRVPEYLRLGSMSIYMVGFTYGAFIPRLSGMVADQNRAAIPLLFFAWAVAMRPGLRPRRGYVALAGVLLLATLSRSAMLAAVAMVVVVILERRIRRVPPTLVFALLLGLVGVLTATLVSPAVRDAVVSSAQPIVRRASLEEGSSQVHLVVLQRGIDVATASVPQAVIGLGFGSAYSVLQDVFPGQRYGNFHSLYITILAETGVFALLTLLLMIGVPVVQGGPYRPVLVGMAVFNLFYQSITDPAFWTVLALAWMTLSPWAQRAASRALPAVD